MLRGCILVSPGPQSSPTGPYLGGISTHPTSNPNSSCCYPRPLNIYNITLLTTLYHLCQLTCYEELSTDADTSHINSGGGEVSSRGPCSRASGPGLGRGESGRSMSSAHDKYLHSECYYTNYSSPSADYVDLNSECYDTAVFDKTDNTMYYLVC